MVKIGVKAEGFNLLLEPVVGLVVDKTGAPKRFGHHVRVQVCGALARDISLTHQWQQPRVNVPRADEIDQVARLEDAALAIGPPQHFAPDLCQRCAGYSPLVSVGPHRFHAVRPEHGEVLVGKPRVSRMIMVHDERVCAVSKKRNGMRRDVDVLFVAFGLNNEFAAPVDRQQVLVAGRAAARENVSLSLLTKRHAFTRGEACRLGRRLLRLFIIGLGEGLRIRRPGGWPGLWNIFRNIFRWFRRRFGLGGLVDDVELLRLIAEQPLIRWLLRDLRL